MPRVEILFDIDQNYLMDLKQKKSYEKPTKKHGKNIKIKLNDDLFEIALRKGLIEKTKDGYVFVGDYEDLAAFKNNKGNKNLYKEWLD